MKHSDLATYLDLLREVAIPRRLVGFPAEQAPLEIDRSLALSTIVRGSLIDVGSGAGLPGVPLGVHLGAATLIEPRRKAAGFLEKVARSLEASIEVVSARAENTGLTADTVVARALAAPSVALDICSPLALGRLVLTAPEGAPRPDESLWVGKGFSQAEAATLTGPSGAQQRVLIFDR